MPDIINALFETLGACFTFLSVLKLYKDKCIRGVHYLPIVFFTSWGLWNLFYYSHLEQTYSWYAGILLVSVNTIWLYQMWLYRKN